MSELSQFSCSPVRDGETSLTPEELENLLPLVPSWALVDGDGKWRLQAQFTFHDEAQAAAFVGRMRHHQELEGHRVDVEAEGGRVTVTCHTPAVGGLHPNDFIMAARADGAWSQVIVGQSGDMDRPGNLPKIHQSPRFSRILSPSRREHRGGNA